MEATCQHEGACRTCGSDPESPSHAGGSFFHVYDGVCGAPIPRLDEGPCNAHPWSETDPDSYCAMSKAHYWHNPCVDDCFKPHHAYLGPLAGECERGHAVVGVS